MTLKLAIFDCDGVLVDTEGPVNIVLAENLTGHGLPITAAQTHSLFTGGTMQTAMAEATARGANLPANWLDEIYALMFARLREGVDVIPGVVSLLDRLEAAGAQIAVASNGPMDKMRISLGPSGLYERLDGRIYSREDHAPKPAPDMLLHAMKVAGAAPEETIMIDDSAPGCASAQAAGVRCFGYAVEGQDAALAAVGAEPVSAMSDIARLLGLADMPVET